MSKLITIKEVERFRDWCYHVHDVEVNQKYGEAPYSTHLNYVGQQAKRFCHLPAISKNNIVYAPHIVVAAAYGHDTIEDGRQSYNDVLGKAIDIFDNHEVATAIADIIYDVTDEKGKNRSARKNSKFYEDLNKNELAVYVKLCDMAANTLFSLLNNSSMYGRYKKEFPTFKEKTKTHYDSYKDLYDFVENI